MRASTARALFGAALALSSVTPRSALANGRYPFSQQLFVAPDQPSRLWLRASYGFLRSDDAGRRFEWVCEEAIGYSGTEDPSLGVAADGALLAGIFKGLSVSRDLGCSFTFPFPELTERFVVDLTVEAGDPRRVIVLTSNGKGGGKFDNQLWRSTDAGKSFGRLGPPLPDDLLSLTLDPAPSEPTTLYVSGVVIERGDAGTTSRGVLLRSIDDAQSFQRFDVTGSSLAASPFIAAVHPTRPRELYVRLNGTENEVRENDALVVSVDGGESWREIAREPAHLGGFALSPDGSELMIGYGDARAGLEFDPARVGLYRGSTSDFSLRKVGDGRVSCITWRRDAIYLCGSQFDQGFELGVSRDDARSFQGLLRLPDVAGPLTSCAADSGAVTACSPRWPQQCERLGGCADAGDDGGDGGAAPPPPVDKATCGCSAPGRVRQASALVVVGAAYCALGLRKRRTKRSLLPR